MQQLIMQFLQNHLQLGVGLVMGWAAANSGSIIGFLVNQLFRIPAVSSYCAAHPAQIKAIVDQIDKDVDENVDNASGANPGPISNK